MIKLIALRKPKIQETYKKIRKEIPCSKEKGAKDYHFSRSK